jgi:hypothetical protein
MPISLVDNPFSVFSTTAKRLLFSKNMILLFWTDYKTFFSF